MSRACADPLGNCFAVKYGYFCWLGLFFQIITFKGYVLDLIASLSLHCLEFIPFLPSEAENFGHRTKKTHLAQDVSRKKCQMSAKS